MVTIRHLLDDGKERIVTASSVAYDAKENTLEGHTEGSDVIEKFSSGRIYVMNENGKTVGVYNLNK